MKLTLDEVLGINEELKLTSIFKFAIITLTDEKGIIVDCNENFLQISGFKRAEVIGKPHQEMIQGEEFSSFSEEEWRADIKNYTKDGEAYWVDTQVTPIKNKRKKTIGYLSLRHDITERKKREKELEDVSHRFEDVQEIASVGAWVYHIERNSFSLSEWIINRFGFSGEEKEYPVELISEFVHFKEVEDWKRIRHEYIKTGNPFEEELRFVSGDETLWLKMNGRGVYNQKGEFYEVVGTVQDITQRKRIEELLREIQADTKLGGWQLDIETMEPIWTEQTYRIHNMVPGSKIGVEESVNCYAKHQREHLMNLVTDCIENGVPYEDTFEFTPLGGSEPIFIRTNGVPVRDENGKIFRIRGFIQDVTEKELAKRDLDQERNLNIQASKMVTLGEMAGGVAHEINNPLMVVQGFSKRMLKKLKYSKNLEEVREKFHENLERIIVASERMGKIVNGMRIFSRDASADELEPAVIQDIVQDAISFVGERYRNKEIDVHLQIDQLQHQVFCRKIQLSQVVLNLLNNAYDALVEDCGKGEIHIGGEVQGNFFLLKIRDNGPGVPKKILDKIMNPFFTTKEVGKGTGLGLSISKSIMKDHGGDLYYLDEGKGACFVLKTPLANSQPVSKAS